MPMLFGVIQRPSITFELRPGVRTSCWSRHLVSMRGPLHVADPPGATRAGDLGFGKSVELPVLGERYLNLAERQTSFFTPHHQCLGEKGW